MNYNDGTNCKIPLSYQVNVEDWWAMPQNVEPAESEIVWKGQNERTKSLDYHLQLYKYTWENPHPLKEIETIDLVSEMERTGIMLYAITVVPEN
ncbi:MAG: hypothetical protein HQ543_03540 [Bacteroidetes bacterium]|nr:hypothetical protein [Bacteroidota bacterium]